MGGPHPVCQRSEWNQRLSKKILAFYLPVFELAHWTSPGFAFALGLKLIPMGSSGSPACWLQSWTSQLPNHMSQFLIVNIAQWLYFSISYRFHFSGESKLRCPLNLAQVPTAHDAHSSANSSCPALSSLWALLLFSPCVWLFATPWTATCQASLSFTISWVLFKLCPLSRWCYLAISSSATLFSFCLLSFQWVISSHQMAKYWSFSFSISPSNEYSGLIFFRIDWSPCCLL